MVRARLESRGAKVMVFAAVGLALISILPVLGPVMHESDQAAILQGSVQLSRGAISPWAADCYNYDKQYLTYWILAGTHRLLPTVDIVTLGNFISFAVFWGGLAAAIATGRIRRLSQAVGICACILAPALLLHSGFLASAFVSAGFLLFAWTVWKRFPRGNLGRIAGIFLLFVAVGCRADALLILPWFAWTVSPPRILALGKWPLWTALAGIAAFLLGRHFYTGAPVDIHQPFLRPNIYAAYVVFGFGAAAGVVLWLAVSLLAITRRRWSHRRQTAWFYLLGLPALLLPWAYYSLQLFSTRYWTLTLCAALGALSTRRGTLLLQWPRRPRFAAVMHTLILSGAVLPLLVGIHLPFPDRPRPVLAGATVFPTADGLQPMGAIRAFLREQASNPDSAIDHNHSTWLAAKDTMFEKDETGRVPVLDFSLRTYVLLSAALQGLDTRVVSQDAPWYYTDRRDLLRVYHTPEAFSQASRRGLLEQITARSAGPTVAGYGIVRVEHARETDAGFRQSIALARVFKGNEFRVLPAYPGQREIALARRDTGKTVVLFSNEPFVTTLIPAHGTPRPIAVRSTGDPLLYHAVIPGRDWIGATFEIISGDPSVAITVHPDYMSVDRM